MPWPRRLRKVRLHMLDDRPSIEGLLVGRANGHYRIARAELLEGEGRTHDLSGEVWVPASRVAFYQLMDSR